MRGGVSSSLTITESPHPSHLDQDEFGLCPSQRNGKGHSKRATSLSRDSVVLHGAKDLSQRVKERAEVAYLVKKLVAQQEKTLQLEEQLSLLRLQLKEEQSAQQSAQRSTSPATIRNIYPTTPSVYDGMVGNDMDDADCKLTELYMLSHLSKESIKWSTTEIQTWETASLSQLVSMRRKLLSSLYGVSDAIKRRNMSAMKARRMSEDVGRESEAEIRAAMHRLFGEAFYVISLKDIEELNALAEIVNRVIPETFDAALQNLKVLTESENILYSYKKLQAFISDSSLHFTDHWRKQYMDTMRNFLLAFTLSLQGVGLFNTRRAELETIASQEMFHTTLLRAARGRDVLSPPTSFLVSDANIIERSPELVPRPHTSRRALSKERMSTSTQGRQRSSYSAIFQPRSSSTVKERWNAPRAVPRLLSGVESIGRSVSRRDSAPSTPRRRDQTLSCTPTRRRTAETLGLHPMYRKSQRRGSSPPLGRPPPLTVAGLRPFTPVRLNFANYKNFSVDEL